MPWESCRAFLAALLGCVRGATPAHAFLDLHPFEPVLGTVGAALPARAAPGVHWTPRCCEPGRCGSPPSHVVSGCSCSSLASSLCNGPAAGEVSVDRPWSECYSSRWRVKPLLLAARTVSNVVTGTTRASSLVTGQDYAAAGTPGRARGAEPISPTAPRRPSPPRPPPPSKPPLMLLAAFTPPPPPPRPVRGRRLCCRRIHPHHHR